MKLSNEYVQSWASELCRRRCKPEIVFRLAEELSGTDLTPDDRFTARYGGMVRVSVCVS